MGDYIILKIYTNASLINYSALAGNYMGILMLHTDWVRVLVA